MPGTALSRGAFFDRDGTIIVDTGYPIDPSRIEFLHGVPQRMAALEARGFKIVVITNQSGVARGLFSKRDVDLFNESLAKMLHDAYGVTVAGFYCCFHHPDITGPCECRKPGTLLVRTACRDLGIDAGHSIFIGDKATDIECGIRAGMASMYVGDFSTLPLRESDPDVFSSALMETMAKGGRNE